MKYKHVYLKGRRGSEKKTYCKDVNSERTLENLHRIKQKVIDYSLCNKFKYFCTFTFSEKNVCRTDYNEVKQKLTRFLSNVKNRYCPDLKYLVIPEFHKDGAFHFHGFIDGIDSELSIPPKIHCRDKKTGELLLVDNVHGYLRWNRYNDSLGWFECSIIKSMEKSAFYVTKYITKDLIKMPANIQLLLCSKGLLKPVLVNEVFGISKPFVGGFDSDFCSVKYQRDDEDCLLEDFGLILSPWSEFYQYPLELKEVQLSFD